MRVAMGVVGALALAGCTSPYYYPAQPAPISYAPPPLITPYTARPYYQPPAYVPAPEPPPPEIRFDPGSSDPAAYETPPMLLQPLPDTVETPSLSAPGFGAPRPATVLVQPQPADSGGAVPMMGFRPMKGQRTPTP